MSEQTSIPLLVLAASREHAEAVNGILRRAGHAVRCDWIASLREFNETLPRTAPELILHVAPAAADLKAAAAMRDQQARAVPIVAVDTDVREERIAECMQLGASDLVSLEHPVRLTAVVGRELRAHRIERAFQNTVRHASDARRQLSTVLQRSNDAIARVQEGIVVDVNASWLALSGWQLDGVVGQPVMDLVDPAHHAALRTALAGCLDGRGDDQALTMGLRRPDGSHAASEVMLALVEHDGEPCVQLIIHSRHEPAATPAPAAAVAPAPVETPAPEPAAPPAVERDPGTGLLFRLPLLQAIYERMHTPLRGGGRWFAVVRPDRFATVERDFGVSGSETVLGEFTNLLREGLHPNEFPGRLGGVSFLVLLERGTERDVEAWGRELAARVARHRTSLGGRAVSLTCTVGIGAAPATTGLPGQAAQLGIDTAISNALEVCRAAQQSATGRVVMADRGDDAQAGPADEEWAKRIRAALMDNRFRLVQQPIASLQGVDPGMADVLVRMLDESGREVLPGEFMPAAARSGLLKTIDRWVVGASLAFTALRKPNCLFVRLSADTLQDGTFTGWLESQLRSSRAEPGRICFQTPAAAAATRRPLVQKLSADLHERGFRFALEGFGAGSDAMSLMEALQLDYLKIDGAVVQGLTRSAELRERVKELVAAAAARNIDTIAERVEDANTMAVLWQLGVQYLQGYLVNAPEEIVLKAER